MYGKRRHPARTEIVDSRTLTAKDFSAFFHEAHGYSPFPWQQRLTEQVLADEKWPEVIDLPTGTGKTAVLDTAVFALAAKPTVFPRRVVFVIDRRIVVDQVCKRALQIAEALEKPLERPTTALVSHRLQALSAGGKPLGVAALRGGIPLDNRWSREPDEPWVLVSTVDQFGSRLLFRGYGVNPRMRPVHAGLAGNDSLVILDEVHLSVPFAETLGQIGMFEPARQLPRRFAVVEMSATPSNTNAYPFQLDEVADLDECEELGRRVRAAKQARLVNVQNHKAMPAKIVKEVKMLTRSDKTNAAASSVGVVVNRVRTARETHIALRDAGYATHLITGRMRALDRIDALHRIDPAVDPERNNDLAEPTIVVATQAIEVGADFSFDALITECAAVDSLKQRFGRLDRRGTYHKRTGKPAQAVILGPKSVVGAKKPDPIYGESVKVTWAELHRSDADHVDVGSLALSDFPCDARAPKDKAPLVLRTHMDAWVQTKPEPLVQPAVDKFLHGMESSVSPDVSIVWRRDTSAQVLRLVPPRQVEFLQVPVGAARAWLRGDDEPDISDVPATVEDADVASSSTGSRRCVRWEGMDKKPEPVQAADIGPGDILVVDVQEGGIQAGTWDPTSEEVVLDLGDRAQFEYDQRRATLRLDQRLFTGPLADLPVPPTPDDEPEAVQPRRKRIDDWLGQLKQEIGSESESEDKWLYKVAQKLLDDGFDITPIGMKEKSSGMPYYVLSQRRRHSIKSAVDQATMDGSDESNSLQGTGATLRAHLKGVEKRVGQYADALRLPRELADDLRLAGRLHDVGKVDRRFQEQLVGGDPVELEMLEEPLAKSQPGTRPVWRYPKGMRHEIGSLALAMSSNAVLSKANDPELVLHLIGTHHGYGRPLPQIPKDDTPQQLKYDGYNGHVMTAGSDLTDTSLAPDMADRFWRLVDSYGYYGLAWLETILRLADHRESEEAAS